MSQQLILDADLQADKNLVWWLYIGHSASFLFSLGAFSWLPLIINYIKRGGTRDTFLYSHHSWMIRSFWWYVFWIVIGFVCFLTVIGIPVAWLIWTCAWLWKAYRLVRGMIDLNHNQAMP